VTTDRQERERNQEELERRLARIERRFGIGLLQACMRSCAQRVVTVTTPTDATPAEPSLTSPPP
jgi:hypothetical protein